MGSAGLVPAGLRSRYRDAVLVGRGGMGEVYRARDEVLDRLVAVKVLGERFVGDAEARTRFRREAAAAARLSGQPNVVSVYDFGEADGVAWIAMEWCPNGSLLEYVGEHEVGVARVLDWLREAAAGLDAAHSAGLVHRDVKPANLLLDAGLRVKVADFGVARLAGPDTGITKAGSVIGTAGYMSPEQARGEPVTAASDRYALAVIGFELLAGRRPFESADAFDEARSQAQAAVPKISDLAPVPAAANRVFTRALAKHPGDRYMTAGDFASVLAAALKPSLGDSAPTVVAAPTRQSARSQLPPAGRPGWRRRMRWMVVGASALLAAVFGVAAAYLTTRPNRNAASVRVLTRVITVQGATHTQVVTVRPAGLSPSTVTITAQPNAAARSSGPASSASTVLTAHQLNDQGYALINRGQYAEAVPLLERAVGALQGTGPTDPYEAYANYNLGYALLQLGRCRAAIPPLNRANHLETARSVDAALARARACT